VVIDGTKLEANAISHKSMGYSQLSEQEQYWKQKVDELLQRAGEVDTEEDRRWARGNRPMRCRRN
jgi:hypothetical protein